jgi:streptomycin 6-kinase
LQSIGRTRGGSDHLPGAPINAVASAITRRADQLSEELGFDRERLVSWGLAQAVLAAWWSYDDNGHGWEQWITCAELLSPLLSRAN